MLDALEGIGCVLDRGECLHRFRTGNVAIVRLDDIRVDLFVPSIPFYVEAEKTVQIASFGGNSVPVLSAEALAVFKLLFFRNKDRVDLRTLVERRLNQLDTGYVRAQVADMMGDEDERVRAWDEICQEFGLPTQEPLS